MAAKKDFEINRRVSIAIDALSPSQKAAINPMLGSREDFVAHAKRPGSTERLATRPQTYSMNAGRGMRIIFTMKDDHIVVQDIMQKSMLDQLMPKRKPRPAKKAPTPTSVN